MSRRTILQQQLEKSRRLLSENDSKNAISEGENKEIPSSLRGYIRQRNMPPSEDIYDGPFQRTTAAAVKQQTGDFGTIAAERIQRMRQGVESDAPMINRDDAGESISLNTPAWSLGESSESKDDRDGATPVWREILSQQRAHTRPSTVMVQQHASLTGNTSMEGQLSPLQPVAEELALHRPSWPALFIPNEIFSWDNFQAGPENRLASTAAREVIIHPAERTNPLIILGDDGVGKSHLLWAIGSSYYNQIPDTEVRMISGVSFPKALPEDWTEAVQGCSALLVDDFHMVTDPVAHDNLGLMIDWCLNLGVQVVITSLEKPPLSGTLAGALGSAVPIEISRPDELSLVLYLRNRVLRRGLSLSDEQLRVIASNAAGNWSSAAAGFEAVALAIEAGAEPFGITDIESILAGQELPMRDDDGLITWDSEATGQKIVREVLDHVLPREQQPNIDLVSVLESQVDDYQPPNLIPDNSRDAVDSLIERHLGREKGALDDARERIEQSSLPTELEAPRAGIPNLDLMSETFLERLESRLHRHQDELFSLHEEMEHISANIDGAEPKELVEMADRMLEIERKLARISRLDAGEALLPRKKPERPYKTESIEEFLPEGEWDIDESDVSADDLLGKPQAILRPVQILKLINSEEE